MNFKEFRNMLNIHVDEIVKNDLFIVDIDKDHLYKTYLDSFPKGSNKVFRKAREFDCSSCRNFIKFFGRVVIIKDDLSLESIWDFRTGSEIYDTVLKQLSKEIKKCSIKNVFLTEQPQIGIDKNHEITNNGNIVWHHFFYRLPQRHIKEKVYINKFKSDCLSNKETFKRSLKEISEDSISTVLDLISQKSLYKGDEWKNVLKQFLKIKKEYKNIKNLSLKDRFCWKISLEKGPVISKIKNHSIGTLLLDISEEIDLDKAVRKYEKIVAPSNYKRPKPIFTKKMVEQAENKLKELGLEDSLKRRHSIIDDITVPNIIFSNRDIVKKEDDIFSQLKKEVSKPKKSFSKTSEISIEDFIKDIIPNIEKMEIYFENKHIPNLVSLITSENLKSPSLFKWDNPFSWSYKGNITDSMKERVKAAGGNVEGFLRFSLQWNEEGDNNDDLDAHCKEPNGNHIWFQNKGRVHRSSGMLDIDIIEPFTQKEAIDGVAVENIIYTDLGKMPIGKYLFYVHNYTSRGGKSGFNAEIECDGEIHTYFYKNPLKQGEIVNVAKVELKKDGTFKVTDQIDSQLSQKTIWNISTNQFHPVSFLMYSPNYWNEVNIGNKHYFFLINECLNNEEPSGFFNEFLKDEFREHRKVFEALSNKMRVNFSKNQLSGLGFSSTIRNSLICKVDGNFSRTLKILF